jgi:hypothetical protein
MSLKNNVPLLFFDNVTSIVVEQDSTAEVASSSVSSLSAAAGQCLKKEGEARGRSESRQGKERQGKAVQDLTES